MGIQRTSRSSAVVLERGMARAASVSLVVGLLLAFCEPAVSQVAGAGPMSSPGPVEVSGPGGGALNLPIPIPTSLRFYEGSDVTIDTCPRDQVHINGTCHRLLTQGPCQPSDFVLLDPNTYEGYCAARLCAPDRIFVFSDQLCHDPFTSTHCKGSQELFQTAFGTPICQCPDGFLEGEMGRCIPPLTPTFDCPPGQVLWSNNSRSMQVCGPDPCGRLNLDRPLPSPPFVPSLADGTCYQLGQVSGVCPLGTFYSLDLESRRGVCAPLEAAGYLALDPTTQRLYQDLFGAFTLLHHTLPPPPPLTHGPAELMAGGPGTLVGGSAGLSQQIGDPVQVGQGGPGAFGQGTQQGSGAVTTITLGGVAVSGPRGHEAAYVGHQLAGHPSKKPHPRNHFIRGHSLGPTRQYKFSSLSKHFMPTRLDLTRLHATRGHNHLVRPLHSKTHRGATAPVKVKVLPARLLAQAILSGHNHHADLGSLPGLLTETQEAEDESLEAQDSAAESYTGEEKSATTDYTETVASRHRRAAQGSGLVETRLVTCRAGARRHVNAKCRHTLLPFSSLPPSTLVPSTGMETGVPRRSIRSAAPLIPSMSCPQGTLLNLRRHCDLTTSASASLNALSLD